MRNFFGRLSSRKFLLTIGGIVAVTLFPEASTPIVTLVGIFVGAEGGADAVERYATQKTVQTQLEQDTERLQVTGGEDPLQVDKTSFTSGELNDLPM
jgi:hypothetical protein